MYVLFTLNIAPLPYMSHRSKHHALCYLLFAVKSKRCRPGCGLLRGGVKGFFVLPHIVRKCLNFYSIDGVLQVVGDDVDGARRVGLTKFHPDKNRNGSAEHKAYCEEVFKTINNWQ